MPNHHKAQALETSVDRDVVEATRLDPRLGEEIKSLRKARGLTLDALARATHLSAGFLSQIERGQNRPSVNALFDISRTLGVSVGWFFATEAQAGVQQGPVVRQRQRRVITFEDGIRDELLTPGLTGKLELLSCIFPPGSGIDTEFAHSGEEAGVVIRGALELWVDGVKHHLAEGDSFSFDSSLPHKFRNPSAREAEVIWAITPPSF